MDRVFNHDEGYEYFKYNKTDGGQPLAWDKGYKDWQDGYALAKAEHEECLQLVEAEALDIEKESLESRLTSGSETVNISELVDILYELGARGY